MEYYNVGILAMRVVEMDTKEKLTVEEVINKVVTKPISPKLMLLVVFTMVTTLSWSFNVWSTAFAGQIVIDMQLYFVQFSQQLIII